MVKDAISYRVSYMSDGAGFLPSTVSLICCRYLDANKWRLSPFPYYLISELSQKKRCWRAGFPENYDLFGKFGSSPKLFMNEKTQLPLLGIVKRPTPLKSNTDTKNGHILTGATFSKPSFWVSMLVVWGGNI